MADMNVRYKSTPRSSEDVKKLQSRLNRVIGQLNGIKTMLDDNRYCEDILIQLSAVESAMRSFGYALFAEHLSTCVSEQIKSGSETVVPETMELIKRL